jgi:hypothetical protein
MNKERKHETPGGSAMTSYIVSFWRRVWWERRFEELSGGDVEGDLREI